MRSLISDNQMSDDIYYNIAQSGEGQIREKMSRFLAFAFKISSAEEAKQAVKRLQNEYHDARHVCWAYAIGPEGLEWQLNDNGEPSGTAGKPILGQIRSLGLTDVLVCVVRYFGGIKLGTSGLTQAYREAARLALEDAGRTECYVKCRLFLRAGYERVDAVMKVISSEGVETETREFDNVCRFSILVRESLLDEVKGRLEKIESVEIEEK